MLGKVPHLGRAGWSSGVLRANVSVGREESRLDKETEAEQDALGLVRCIL